MRNKILKAGILASILFFAGTVSAVGQSGNESGAEVQVLQQTQTENQGESNQIQTQNNEQTQNGSANQPATGTQNQQQTQQRLQDETGTGTQVQNQNQERNQGENNLIQTQEQEGSKGQIKSTADQRRSQVANAVQEMLQVANRNGGIGQQVKTIANAQNQNQEKLEASLQKIQSRSGFVKFLVGHNYGEINNAQKLLEQNRKEIKNLNQIKSQIVNQGDAQTLTEQIRILEQANLQVEDSLESAQKGFSLFGWLFKLLNKSN